MGVPRVYRQSGEDKLASYDFYDLATGSSYKTFYAITAKEYNQTSSGALVTEILETETRSSASGGGGYQVIWFDLPINVPLEIEGKAIINIPFGMWGNDPAHEIDISASGSLIKVVGNTETLIGNTYFDFMITSAGSVAQWAMSVGKINIPKTILKPGEKLRLKIEGSVSGGTNYFRIWHDPKNYQVDTTTLNTTLLLNLPINVDI